MQPDEELIIKNDGEIEWWTINRETRKNSLSRALVRLIGQECDRALLRRPRAIVITGSGAIFCAGADLKERQGMSLEDVRDLLSLYRFSLSKLDELSIPTVALINGAALGGGLELALCCDFRIAVQSAKLALPETTLGIIPGAGGTQRLVREVGAARAREMIVFGTPVTAEKAEAIGLVHRVVGAGEDSTVVLRNFLAPLGRTAPLAVGQALMSVHAATSSLFESGITFERAAYEKTLVSEDRNEALAALRESRAPIFKGQ